MNRVLRIITRLFLVVGFLLLLVIPVSGLISAALHWEGVCAGPDGVQTACSWWKYASNEMFWGIFIFIPFLFLAAVVFLGMSLLQFAASLVEKFRRGRGDAKG